MQDIYNMHIYICAYKRKKIKLIVHDIAMHGAVLPRIALFFLDMNVI